MAEPTPKVKHEEIVAEIKKSFPEDSFEDGFKKFCVKVVFSDIVDDNEGIIESALLEQASNKYNISAYLKDTEDAGKEKRYICSFSSLNTYSNNISDKGLEIFANLENKLQEITNNDNPPESLKELISDYKDKNATIHEDSVEYQFYYFTSFDMDNKETIEFQRKLQKNYFIYSLSDLYDKYEKYREKYLDSINDCELTFKNQDDEDKAFIKYDFGVANLKRKTSIIGTVSGSELIRLYENHRTKLFERNVREFLGAERKDSVNNGIVTTAIEQPTHFYFYNNGITITCDSVEDKQGSNKVHLLNANIINGAQTISSLNTAYSQLKKNGKTDKDLEEHFKKINVLTRIVQTPRGEEADFTINVTKYNNSQNKVKAQDFGANDSVQKNLHEKLKKHGYFYENKRNSINSETGGKTYEREGKYIKVNDIAPLYYSFVYKEIPPSGQNIYVSQKYMDLVKNNFLEKEVKEMIMVHNLSKILHDIYLAVKNGGDERKYKHNETTKLEYIFKNENRDTLEEITNKDSILHQILKNKNIIMVCIAKAKNLAGYDFTEYYKKPDFYSNIQSAWLQKIMLNIEENYNRKVEKLRKYISLESYFKKYHGILDFESAVISVKNQGFSPSRQFPLD